MEKLAKAQIKQTQNILIYRIIICYFVHFVWFCNIGRNVLALVQRQSLNHSAGPDEGFVIYVCGQI